MPPAASEIQKQFWTASDFVFHTGERLDGLRIGYLAFGNPSGTPVLILHGTNSSSVNLLNAAFADPLFNPGQPLDAATHHIIMPDAIGAGDSSKPSDGLGPNFPRYNLDDLVTAQYRLLTEGLGIEHVKVIVGNSMGGMLAWLWGIRYPEFMHALVPLACAPAPMSGRNWMLRRLVVDMVQNDPGWMGGAYTSQPACLQTAALFYNVASNGGDSALQANGPTRSTADAYLGRRRQQQNTLDANDFVYQLLATRDYDPSNELNRITCPILAINATDDERNPTALDLLAAAVATLPQLQTYLIKGSPETAGHGTTLQARWWADQLQNFLTEIR